MTLTDTPRLRWKLVLLQLLFAYLLALKLWFDVAVTPMGDESYYWMWGQHLSWSYFDHPPLHAWLLAGVEAIFGWSNFSVRLLTWLTLGATLWVLWLWSRRLAPADRAGWFWPTAVIYLTIPVIFVMTTFAFHDHLLLVFVIASLYFFDGFAADWERAAPRWANLYISAALLGFAVLSKYNGVFLGLGFAVWILIRPQLRTVLRTRHPWLAALLAIAMQAPVFYWNLTENLASFRFHLADRPLLSWSHPSLTQVLVFLADMVVLMSPVLFLSLFRIPFLKRGPADEQRVLRLSTTLYLVSTLAWAAIALYLYVYVHWNIVAYAALAPIAHRLLGRVALWLHIGIGLVLITVGVLNYTVRPLNILGFTDIGAPANYGWPELAARVLAQQAEHPQSFLAASRYTYAAQLGFQLHQTDVAALSSLPSQNDYWWNAAAHEGEDAIIIADRTYKIDAARAHFRSMKKLETMPVVVAGQTIWSFDLWLGKGYDGQP